MKNLIFLLLLLLPRPAAALSTDELLSLVAMPLAVAAVADLTNVPANELADLVATLNQANVAPTEFVDVIRYVPVALVTDSDQPGFMQFVHTQADQGVRGTALVNVIEQRLEVKEPERIVYVDRDYIPPVVQARVIKVKEHPHGGPPGQLKKQLGFQTGAEVVHRAEPTRTVVITRPAKEHEHGGGKGHGHGNGQGKDKGHGGGNGKGHGKGKH